LPAQKTRWKLLAIVLCVILVGGSVGFYLLPKLFEEKPAPPEKKLIESTKLYGKIFFDYNGNGIKDADEPAIKGVEIKIGNKTVTTNDEGEYTLNLKKGEYVLSINPPKNFEHMCTSADEFRSVAEEYDFNLYEDKKFDVGLMEGFLTLPYSKKATLCPENSKYGESMNFYDRDGRIGYTKFWDDKPHGYDQHHGTDYFIKYGEDILAAAPGIVRRVFSSSSGALVVTIDHKYFSTEYVHLSKAVVEAGAKVKRGEKIAECGSSGTSVPHLHFNLFGYVDRIKCFLDPYKPVFTLDEHTQGLYKYELVSEQPIRMKWMAKSTDLILKNYWTVENKPQFAD